VECAGLRTKGSPAGTASSTSDLTSAKRGRRLTLLCRLTWADGRKPAYLFTGQPQCATAPRVAFLAPVVGWAIVAYVNVLLGAAPPSLAQLAGWLLIVTSTLGFLINPFGGAWEEPGWRGYALPLLLRRHSALVASAVLGVMWAFWHIPLFLTGLPWPDAALVFALSFVFTALYLRTGGSVLIAFLLHASINGAGEFFVGLFSAEDRVRMYWIMAALCAVVVIAAIVVSRNRWRRVPAVRDNDDAAIGPPLVAEATGGRE
jgi:membrane protease YdiL (CAAX protease family)